MAKLGDAFPAHTRRALIEKQLTPGCVVRITVKFTEVTKPKLLVLVADDDPDYCWFIINSEINAYVRKRPHLYQCQVKIDATAHDFLKRDSYLACDKLLRLKRDDVIRELVGNIGEHKGTVSNNVRDEIRSAVKIAATLSRAEKTKILPSLTG